MADQKDNAQDMVTEFHLVGGYPIRRAPEVPPDAEVRFRLRLIAEEFFEQFAACFHGVLQKQLVADAEERIRQVIDRGQISHVSLPDLADAWADLQYVIVGSNVTFGIDGDAVFRVVHDANMMKFGPGAARDPSTGKPIKPPGWRPPDIAGELERQKGSS